MKTDESLFEDSTLSYRIRSYRKSESVPTHERIKQRVCREVGIAYDEVRDDADLWSEYEGDVYYQYQESIRRKKTQFLLTSLLTDSRLRIGGTGKQVHESWSCLTAKVELMQLVLAADSEILHDTRPSPLTKLVDTLSRYVVYIHAVYHLHETCKSLGLDITSLDLPDSGNDVRARIVEQARDRQAAKKMLICYDGLTREDAARVARIQRFVQKAWAIEEQSRVENVENVIPVYGQLQRLKKLAASI